MRAGLKRLVLSVSFSRFCLLQCKRTRMNRRERWHMRFGHFASGVFPCRTSHTKQCLWYSCLGHSRQRLNVLRRVRRRRRKKNGFLSEDIISWFCLWYFSTGKQERLRNKNKWQNKTKLLQREQQNTRLKEKRPTKTRKCTAKRMACMHDWRWEEFTLDWEKWGTLLFQLQWIAKVDDRCWNVHSGRKNDRRLDQVKVIHESLSV